MGVLSYIAIDCDPSWFPKGVTEISQIAHIEHTPDPKWMESKETIREPDASGFFMQKRLNRGHESVQWTAKTAIDAENGKGGFVLFFLLLSDYCAIELNSPTNISPTALRTPNVGRERCRG